MLVLRRLAAGLLAGLLLAPAAPVRAAERLELAFELREGKLLDARTTQRVPLGRDVAILWLSDRAVMLHLHGYDLELALEPGVPATMSFLARAAGRFPLELHGAGGHRTLLYLEVRPE